MKAYRFLLIDDDPDDQEMLEQAILKVAPGSECVIFIDGKMGIDYLKNGQEVDAIFLDLNMPVFGGIDFLEALKNDHVMFKKPVFIYSTSREEIDKQRAYKAGAMDYIVKPNRYQILLDNVESVIKKHLS